MSIETATMVRTSRTPADGSPSRELDDLLAQACRGDTRAFDRLMQRHERQVYGTARRLLGRCEDAQDAAQEVFLRLFRFLDRIEPHRPLAPWLYRVTVNVCRDLGRRRRLRQTVPLEEVEHEAVGEGPDPAARAAIREEKRIVEEALASLSHKERAALVLRDVEGLPTEEVAEILGSSPPTVRSQICRARLKIRQFRQRRLKGTLP
ncbi:MAG: RNA polymerase sigma factor [bacterium]|nr:RNA polymerase sigma factor [bacterium]